MQGERTTANGTMPRMASGPAHTPWDGSHAPFRIGLQPLDSGDWIEVDERLGEYLAEKERLLAENREGVFAAESGTRDAQKEILELLAAHLPVRFPQIYRMGDRELEIVPTGRRVKLAGAEQPLLVAARLVQEDLIVMRRSEHGWRLVAASLSFPSTWSLREKFGRPLQDIHEPVPEFGPGTRNAELINRIFDRMRPQQPLWRANWSLYSDDRLHHGENKTTRYAATERKPGSEKYIRVEYQTLRKLPQSGDILFTVRIQIDPLAFIAGHPERKRLAGAFRASLRGLDAEQLAYKGLGASRAILLETLAAMADQ